MKIGGGGDLGKVALGDLKEQAGAGALLGIAEREALKSAGNCFAVIARANFGRRL